MGKIRFKKLRLWLVYPFFMIYFFAARMTDISFVLGVIFMALGLGVRFWASGHIRKSRVLAISGPYAYTRNPLYLGNFILGFGIAVISNNLWLLLYYLVSFFLLYAGTIKEEQRSLEEKFGEPYRDYVHHVPVFWPSWKAYRKAQKDKFSLRQSFQNGEFIRICGFVLLILTLFLWQSFAAKKARFDFGEKAAMLLFVVFFYLLWFNIYIRRKSEEKG